MEQNGLQTVEPQNVEVLTVSNAESLAAITRSEIDVQITTAKQYPRNLAQVLNNIETLATMDDEIAASCFYTLRRQGKVIEGPSVRLAEIIASSWGNLRVQARIIGNDGKMITAQGVCHDLESNYATSTEVKRRITDKGGKTYSEDMQVITGNAACAIAMRNALFKVVPAALMKKVIDKAKKVALGESMPLEKRRVKMLQYFNGLGIDEKQVLSYLAIEKVDEIDIGMIVELTGLATAIKDGEITAKEAFATKVVDEKKAKDVAEKFSDFNKQDNNTKEKKDDSK